MALATSACEVRLWNPMCYDILGMGAAYDDLLANAVGNGVSAEACVPSAEDSVPPGPQLRLSAMKGGRKCASNII